MAERRALIKKYSDRRLYDSTARRYVNLDELARMIREGVDVQVLDARTGKDLTRVILTQIIMDDTRDGEASLPLKLLRQLVLASDRATHEFLSWYLETAFDLYKKAGTALRSGVSEAKSVVSSPVDFVRNLLSSDNPELEDLRRRVKELEARLARRERRSSTRNRRS
jgi:polyhydroxyalkanoate synthesis repressor PhaR